jgi:outer membrane protein
MIEKLKLGALGSAVAISLVALLVPSVSIADEPGYLIVGGAGARPDYEGSDDLTAFPFAGFKMWWDSGRNIALTGAKSSGSAARLDANIIDKTQVEYLEFGPVLQYRLARDDVDNNQVDALKDVDAAVELGAFVALDFHPLRVQVTGVSDVSDQHSGELVEFFTQYTARITDTFSLAGGIAATWASDDYMEAYFGVDAAGSAASGLSQFDASSGMKDMGVRLTGTWKGPGDGWEHWRVMGLFSWFGLQKDAKDSPIVDDVGNDDQIYGGIAVGWEK